MKITWESIDIKAGRIVGKSDCNELWMIGYFAAMESGRFALISLSDGMIQPWQSKIDLVDSLNQSGEIPFEWINGQ